MFPEIFDWYAGAASHSCRQQPRKGRAHRACGRLCQARGAERGLPGRSRQAVQGCCACHDVSRARSSPGTAPSTRQCQVRPHCPCRHCATHTPKHGAVLQKRAPHGSSLRVASPAWCKLLTLETLSRLSFPGAARRVNIPGSMALLLPGGEGTGAARSTRHPGFNGSAASWR